VLCICATAGTVFLQTLTLRHGESSNRREKFLRGGFSNEIDFLRLVG